MIKKITISIPDELHQRLKEFKGYINISSSCAESLKNKIDKIDLCVQEAKKRFQILPTWEACRLAYKQGIEWAGYDATPVELAIVCNWIDDEKYSELMDLLSMELKEVRSIRNSNSDVYEYIIHSFAGKGIFSKSQDLYHEDVEIAHSFRDGANIVWGQIKNETISKLMDSGK